MIIRVYLIKDSEANALEKQIVYQDAVARNEGKFGEGKRRYGLGRISARLQQISKTVISLEFPVMNLEKAPSGYFFVRFFNLDGAVNFSKVQQTINS